MGSVGVLTDQLASSYTSTLTRGGDRFECSAVHHCWALAQFDN